MTEQQRAELERIRDVLYPATGLEDDDEESIGRVLKDINALLAQDALHKMAEESRTSGLSLDDWDKIGCVNHDCDQCKAVQSAERGEPVESPDDWSDWKVTPPIVAAPLVAQKPWVGLTNEERSTIESEVLMRGENYPEVLAAIEAKLMEKNK
jgi:hypothetical protein